MDDKQLRTSLLAVTAAAAIALAGTFAWQSISQAALNESVEPDNPGGRLHDDFSGWAGGGTKDIYVENFSNQPIFARVRLDEYMEIGQGAGLRQGDEGFDTKAATPLATGADIDDETTWTTHKPDSTLDPGTPEAPADAADPFHQYWTFVLGGQDATDNPEGKTVYMPTFNKNKDSLMADINGTLDGLDPADGLQYDDYQAYLIDETADGVRDATVERGAFYDADDNTSDEGGPYGNGGGLNTNYKVVAETHAAKETLTAKVMTMAEYNALADADPGDGTEWKGSVQAWVYDADGWAYWSQPIAPNTATGVLLDKLELSGSPSSPWYYSINAVAQFITDDALGYADGTGFYTDAARAPTDNALALLTFIGVDTSAVGAP